MSFTRYPDTGTVTYLSGDGTTNSIGVFTPGTTTSISIICRVEPVSAGAPEYGRDENQNTIKIDLNVFTPLMSQVSLINDGKASLHFAGQEYKIVQVPQLQKMTELKCSLNG